MSGIIKPKALQPGDTVALVAPSEPIDRVQLSRVEAYMTRSGYNVKAGNNVLAKIGDYAAGTVRQRAEDLNNAFADPEVKAVFTLVGGMVASQILESVDFELIKKNPKIFVGYSDATTLQMAILAKIGMLTFHGPNALSLPDFKVSGYTLTNLWRVLTATSAVGTIKPQSVWQEVRQGSAEGILFGGNLSCLSKLLGTAFDPIAKLDNIFGKEEKFILFWEEDYEQFSEIMRMLWQIRNSGFFARVSGMVVGKLTAVAEVDYQDFPPKKQLIREVTEPFNFPILYGVDFGHDVPKATIPVGLRTAMDTKKFTLEILEAAVV